MLSASALREVLDYDPETGLFCWRNGTVGHKKTDKVGWIKHPKRGTPYHVINVGRRHNYAHQLAWLWMTGEWPTSEIDHINRDGLDNRWTNLRSATRIENVRNCKSLRVNNVSGTTGVSWHKRNRQWSVVVRGKYVGTYYNKDEAIYAADMARRDDL